MQGQALLDQSEPMLDMVKSASILLFEGKT